MNYKALVIVFSLFAVLSCREVDKLTKFNMEFTETVTIPSTTGINLPIEVLTPDIRSNSESTFAANDTRKDLVEKIILTRLELTVQSPQGSDFSFLKSVEVFISAQDLGEKKIAWQENVPDDIDNFLALETSPDDIKEYIKKDEFKLRLSTVTDEIIANDHQIQVYSVVFVDAKILGI